MVKKLSSMLFGLKSEKLKIADIDIKDAVVFKAEETLIHSSEIDKAKVFILSW